MKADKDLSILRHSAAHLLAHAVLELFPKTQLTIGPSTDEGFFYDCLPEHNFKEDDLPVLEQRMREISARNLPIVHKMVPKAQAREFFKDNRFKLELIDGISDETVGLAIQGDFTDLCRGGHVATTGDIKHFKLQAISGSYWRADRSNQVLQRISGTAFFTAQDMAEYEQLREDALKYDHRKLGKQLDLFSFHNEGVGFPFFHAKGTLILNLLTDYLRGLLQKAGYMEIRTPAMLSAELWKQSGHYAHYKKNMFFCEVEDSHYALKPMNCPGSILVYRERPRSFRELPMRLSEFGQVHRFELSGVLHGLFRVREFTIDDGHIYCTPEQIEQEVLATIATVLTVFKKFGFDNITVGVSTRPEDSPGNNASWEQATKALTSALTTSGVPFEIYEGEGAFYGPKIEFHIKDSMKRSWQCGTVQVDFVQPENFDLEYVASGGQRARPVILHRAIYGSFERFFGVLLEHHKGVLPFWLTPVQARVLTITDAQKEYANAVATQLKAAGIRVEVNDTSDQISGQIKNAQIEKIPWMLVIGGKEVTNNTVTLRTLDGKQEFGLTLAQLLEKATALTQ